MGLITIKQCKQCRRKGIFITLHEDGFCDSCHQDALIAAAEAKRLQQIEEENLRKEKEERERQNAISKYNELVGYYTAHEISLEKCSLDELKQAIVAGQKFCEFLVGADPLQSLTRPLYKMAFSMKHTLIIVHLEISICVKIPLSVLILLKMKFSENVKNTEQY